jgi:hypothetical protein
MSTYWILFLEQCQCSPVALDMWRSRPYNWYDLHASHIPYFPIDYVGLVYTICVYETCSDDDLTKGEHCHFRRS